MVTTSNQEDGASNSSSPNPPSQPEQQPTVTDNTSQMSQSPPGDSTTDASSPLRHPAPLPDEPPITNNENWKRPPPKLMIKIYKVPVGAVVSWHALLTPNHEEISKYQLYSYQEGTQPPSTSLWKKLGDIDPLPLPMACTLSQFSAGYTYHFAIRALDIHGRCGKFSESLSMFMEEDKVADELQVKEEGAVRIGDDTGTTPKKDSNCEELGPVQGKEGEGLVSEEKDLEEKSAGHPRDSMTPVKEVEKMVGSAKESEKAVGQGKEQDKEVAQGKEQDKAKVQAKEQDKEMVQVKEEKDRSPCSC